VKAIIAPLVMTPSFDIMLRIGSHIPMSLAGLGIGRRSWFKTFSASILISRILLRKAKSGPKGKATTNRVINPN